MISVTFTYDGGHSSHRYLVAALLTDTRVLLHSASPHRLYCATSALKALLTPLSYSSVYIPLLPAQLMQLEEAATLLLDCSSPYLIGCETSLLVALGGRLPTDAAVADLDRGTVRRAPRDPERDFSERTPPFASLATELAACMPRAGVQSFRSVHAHAACLRFVIDVLNFRTTGFLPNSRVPSDREAVARIRTMEEFASDAMARCDRARLAPDAQQTVRQALNQTHGAQLSHICAAAAESGEELDGGGSNGGGGGGDGG